MNIIDLGGRTSAQKQGILSQLVVPRPIAMITTLNEDGSVNVAPYSYFMPVCGEPPTIAITIGVTREATEAPKDTWVNLQRTGEFVVNLTSVDLKDHIETVAREYPADVSELDVVGWSTIPSQVVEAPSLAESLAHMECRVIRVIEHGDPEVAFAGVHIVLAEVVCVAVEDALLAGPNRIDPTKVQAVGRMGFPWFVAASESSIFEQERIAYADLAR